MIFSMVVLKENQIECNTWWYP